VICKRNVICDFCGLCVPKGEKYISYIVLPDQVNELVALADGEPDLAPTIITRPDGSVRLDLCLACRMQALGASTPTVQ
jgi:hypothetical protein